ncbi:MAG: energy transducer TonB [Acetobacteraceae bacterium]|nr:energy transducer TonB [Acetobacteraceae bacterium]
MPTRATPTDTETAGESATPAPPSVPQSATATIAPPAASSAATPSPDLSGAWRSALAAWLQEHKTYPDDARRDGEEGRVVVRFTLDRSGTVTDVMLVSSSGHPILDGAAITLLRRARLPPPPAPAPEHLSITLPIRYSLAP